MDYHKVAATRRNVGDLTDPHNNGATIKLGHTVEIIGQVARDLARTSREATKGLARTAGFSSCDLYYNPTA